LENIFSTAPTGIGVVTNRVFTDINEYVVELTGYSREELIGQSARVLYVSEEGYHYVGTEKYRQMREKGTGVVQVQWQHKNGDVLEVILSSTPLDPTDFSAGIVFTVLDITEQVSAQAIISMRTRLLIFFVTGFIVLLIAFGTRQSYVLIERKKMTEALRESREKLRATLLSIGDGVLVSDENGNLIQMNPVAEELTGWTWEEAKGRPVHTIFKIVDTKTRVPLEDPVMKVLRTAQTITLSNDTLLLTKSGKAFQIADSAAPIKNEEGHVSGVVIVFSDVSEKYEQAEKLRESENRFRMLFENMTAGFALHEMIYDANGTPVDYRYLELNPAFERLTGGKSEDLVGRTVLEVMPETEPYWIEVFGKVAKTGNPTSYENYSKEVGKYFDVYAFSPEKDQFAVVFVDITDRKRAEEKVKATMHEMNLLKSALDEVPVCVYMKDEKFRYTYGNKETLKLFGCTEKKFVGKTDQDFFDLETTEKVHAFDRRVIDGEQSHEELETTDIHDRHRVYLEIKTPIFDNDKQKVVGLVGISTDITDRKEAEQKLAESLEEKNVLLSEIHHRVKNNMAVICSLLSLETEFVSSGKDPNTLLKDTHNRIRSMAMVHELVYENKNFAEIDVSILLERLADSLESIYNTENQDISIIVKADTLMLDLQTAIPLSLFANEVISNAYKHAFSNQEKGSIEVELKEEPHNEWRFSIRDSGKGVRDMESLQHPESFGYTIMHGLVRQIRGKLDIRTSDNGLQVEVLFSKW
ncbi:PAS domain S-box protein, partial [Balneolaceae bacterium ANBcel3]|nr:PAS domain S-box protein [Balneolaceae bacterium ANBcel3]